MADKPQLRRLTRPAWKKRWRLAYYTLTFCGGSLAHIIWKDSGSSTHEVAIYALSGLAASVVMAMITGGAWDDKNYMSALTGQGKKVEYVPYDHEDDDEELE